MQSIKKIKLKNTILPILALLIFLFIECSSNGDDDLIFASSTIKELTDQEYPDNCDIESRSDLWDKYNHSLFQVVRNDSLNFTVRILPENEFSDTITFKNINLLSWIPTIPNHIVEDPYLVDIGIINAEWNRQQVRFNKGEFYMSSDNEESTKTVRVDLARNCLNSYAWEVITYTEDSGNMKSMYHGWFDFPKELYRELFDEVNNGKLTFDQYRDHLELYKDPKKQVINLSVLREVEKETEVSFSDFRMQSYPLTGARKSKYKNIVCPASPILINDMLNDSTTYSTFQWPGFYDTSDPRPSTLSMLGIPKKVLVRETVSKNSVKDKCYEFDLSFARNTDTSYITRIVIGGILPTDLQQMPIENYNNGIKKPMGIGNHGFYEHVDYASSHSSAENPYYGFVLDDNGKWVDSHFFGVDGPILHLDETDEGLLHFWLLSFERHAMVAHLTFPLN
ncbi:MAG: hypothetical protein CMD01_00380 [Flavobacteriales bacterium]|nr:hypothetical protein [Flavobacteriales bacterium]